MLSEPYQRRPIHFLELWKDAGWTMKVYGIARGRATPRRKLIDSAKSLARERLASIPPSLKHYNIGFIGVHDGRTANFVFIDWWAEENELHHHVYVSPTDKPAELTYMTPTGLIACVWDLRVMSFEREAWVENILRSPGAPDFDGYLSARLNEET